ncbi:MAG TPA: hypothetical protein DCQ99_05185 [Nitrospinae bacterium]|nr:hypothetical protein [Nitrospinota bacterium]
MSFKIRTKLIIAFLAIIFPFLLGIGVITIYNLNIIYKGIHRVEKISNEMQAVMSLELALDRILMPGNDYIITGEKKYITDFKMVSTDAEGRLREAEEILTEMKETPEVKEEREILKDVKTAWQNIKETSQKIFEIQEPVGNKEAARLIEEMDYKWSYPVIEKLKRWQEIDKKEYRESHEESEGAWRMALFIMIASSLVLTASGIFFALYYSRIFISPIKAIHNGVDRIAAGDFKTRLDIKTGDELQQLSNAMNNMGAQLDAFTSNLEGMVEEKTRELKKSEERYRVLLNAVPDLIFRLSKDGIFLDFKGEKRELYVPPDKFFGKKFSDVLPQEVAQQVAHFMEQAIKTGDIQTFEYRIPMPEGVRDYEARLVAAEDSFIAIVRNITEKKKAEEKIKEQLDYLQRFEKVAVKREFRIKELTDEVEKLKAEIERLKKRD